LYELYTINEIYFRIKTKKPRCDARFNLKLIIRLYSKGNKLNYFTVIK